jgi:hypothetical protein
MSKEKLSVLEFIPEDLKEQLFIEVLKAVDEKKKKNELSPKLKEYLKSKEKDTKPTEKELDSIIDKF